MVCWALRGEMCGCLGCSQRLLGLWPQVPGGLWRTFCLNHSSSSRAPASICVLICPICLSSRSCHWGCPADRHGGLSLVGWGRGSVVWFRLWGGMKSGRQEVEGGVGRCAWAIGGAAPLWCVAAWRSRAPVCSIQASTSADACGWWPTSVSQCNGAGLGVLRWRRCGCVARPLACAPRQVHQLACVKHADYVCLAKEGITGALIEEGLIGGQPLSQTQSTDRQQASRVVLEHNWPI